MHFSRSLPIVAPARRFRARRASAIFIAAALSALLALGGVVAGPAQPAAAANPTTFADLQTAFTAGGAVTLGSDITQAGGGLVVPSGKNVTLNLGGRTLNVTGALGSSGDSNGTAGIAVEGGASLTVVGPGTLQAKGGAGAAGIGGRVGAAIGSITINSGTVTATGGQYAAGIGTGDAGQAPAGSLITIAGGTVTARTESFGGAAIGGGENGAMPDITISGGTVNTEIWAGVGIGAGNRGAAGRTITISGGTVNTYGTACFAAIGTSIYNWNNPNCVPDSKFVNVIIGAGATVNVSVGYPGEDWNPTIGFANSGGMGTFTNAGTVVVTNHVLRIPSNATATNTGTIRGAVDGSLAGNDFVLTFDAWGGHSAPSPLRVTAPTLNAAQVALPVAPIRDGYTFEGWWSSRTGGSKLTTTTALSTSTWYARWSGSGHSITFDPAGGVEIPSINVESGHTFTPPTTTKANYTFAGWFTAVSGGTEWTASTPVTGPTTLYAHWTLTTYTVSFDTGTGGSAVPSQTIAHGSSAAVPTETPTRAGHTFLGWVTTAGGTTTWNSTAPVTSNVTVYARWLIHTYTVTFDTGAGGSTVPSQTVDHGSAAALPAAPTKVGYTFVGWVSASGGTTAWNSGAAVTDDTTVYARWAIKTYTVSFASGAGSAVASQTVEHGSSATVPTPPTRTGYTFGGWVTTSGGTTAWDNTAAVTSDVTVYARWSIDSYTVTFSTGAGSVVASQTVEYGSSAVLPTPPTRTGYSFVGWVTTSGGTTAWVDSAAVTSNVTVYARWAINTYTVSFNTGAGSAVSSQTIEHGSSATVPTAPTRTGYSFVGWVTTSGGTTVWDNTAAVTSDVTVYARWLINTYTVTFDTGAYGSFEPLQSVDHGDRASVPSDAPIRANHSFVGWFTAASGGTTWDGSAAVTGSMTVYAHWLIDSYVVSFDSGGGSTVASQTIDHGQAATVPAAPTRTGYVFAGWLTAPTGGSAWADSAPVTGAMTVYAAWDALVPTTTAVSIEDDLVAIPAGTSVTIFGTVTPSTAVGTIEVFEDGVSIGSGAVVGGVYQTNTVALAGGDYVYTAVFTPGEPRFLTSASASVDLVVNPIRPRVPAPAIDTKGLLDQIALHGWPVRPLPGGLDSAIGKNVPWTDPLDSFVDVYVYSTAQWLGTYAVVGGKVDSGYWAFMPKLSPGPHHLVFVGQTSSSVSAYEFTVPAPAVAATARGTSGLPYTGADPAPWATLGLMLVLLGAGLVVRRRGRVTRA